MSEQQLFAIVEPAHYLAIAIGIATIVAMVARARKQENASRVLRSPRPLSGFDLDPSQKPDLSQFVARESAVGERGVRVRHGSNLADEYDDSVAAFPLSHVDVCYPAFFPFHASRGSARRHV
jgi:hypothetical protein